MARNPTQDEVNALVGTTYEDIHAVRVQMHKDRSNLETLDWQETEWLPALVSNLGEVANWFTSDSEQDISEIRDSLVALAARTSAWIDAIDEGMAPEEEEE